jgi:pyridoxal phosphate enzyme (YggS family)
VSSPATICADLSERIRQASCDRPVTLLAVSKTRTAAEVRALAALGQRAFGENYVQETVAKQAELDDLALEWHLIGHLQSNKAREAAAAFDWVQSVDRIKLVAELARHRPAQRPPLNVLVQVNIDDEASKHGCRPADAFALAVAIAAEPRLALRGLMAIPAPDPDMQRRRDAFRALKQLFDALRCAGMHESRGRQDAGSGLARHRGIDTLSMGMSEDFELAIAEGATMVRIGTALFGARS